MDIRRLRYFLVAAEEQNFHRAAERLHIVQPALSKQMAQLEAELGCELFHRHKRRVLLTAAGQAFAEDARRILRDVEQAAERARNIALGRVGTLRIGFRETAGRSPIVSRSLGSFRAQYPSVELRLTQMTSPAQCEAIRNDELDAGFVYLSPEHVHELDSYDVGVDRFYLAVPSGHPLATAASIQLRDLQDEPFIWLARSKNAYYADALIRNCLQGGLAPKIMQEADSEETIINLVSVGMAASFVVAANARSPVPGVVFRPVIDLTETLTLALVWRRSDSSTQIANFVNVVNATRGALSRSRAAR